MTTRKEIKSELEKIKTNFYDDATPANMLSIDRFGSFLDNNHPLPSGEELLAAAKQKGVKLAPTAIGGLLRKAKQGEELFPETDLWLNDETRDERPANHFAMFVAENFAARTDPEAAHGEPYSMFHDLTSPLNTYKLYTQVNDRRLQGAYITDAIKNTEESDSGHVEIAFFTDWVEKHSILHWHENPQKYIAKYTQVQTDDGYQLAKTEAEAKTLLAANEDTFRRSAAIFAQECHVIKPEHLVAFGGDAANVLRQMKPLFADDPFVSSLVDNLVQATHYSMRGNFTKWVEEQPKKLRGLLGLSEADSKPFD
jgi:hypothetical protein